MAGLSLTRSTRCTLALLLLTAIAFYNAVTIARSIGTAPPSQVGRDDISRYLERFESIQDTVNRFRQVGYVDDAAYYAGWFQAQYALAPTILVQGMDEVLVVANFHRDTSENKRLVESELVLLRDCGNGVRLYRGRQP